MKRFFSLLVVALMTWGALAFQNEPTGFRSAKWGDGVPKDWQKVSQRPKDIAFGLAGDEIYVNPKDELKMGGAKLDAIYYGFWKGKLCCVWVIFQGRENLDALRDICIAQYGPGKAQNVPNPGGELINFSWRGKTACVSLDYKGASPACLTIQSAPLWEQRTAAILAGAGS